MKETAYKSRGRIEVEIAVFCHRIELKAGRWTVNEIPKVICYFPEEQKKEYCSLVVDFASTASRPRSRYRYRYGAISPFPCPAYWLPTVPRATTPEIKLDSMRDVDPHPESTPTTLASPHLISTPPTSPPRPRRSRIAPNHRCSKSSSTFSPHTSTPVHQCPMPSCGKRQMCPRWLRQ